MSPTPPRVSLSKHHGIQPWKTLSTLGWPWRSLNTTWVILALSRTAGSEQQNILKSQSWGFSGVLGPFSAAVAPGPLGTMWESSGSPLANKNKRIGRNTWSLPTPTLKKDHTRSVGSHMQTGKKALMPSPTSGPSTQTMSKDPLFKLPCLLHFYESELSK